MGITLDTNLEFFYQIGRIDALSIGINVALFLLPILLLGLVAYLIMKKIERVFSKRK